MLKLTARSNGSSEDSRWFAVLSSVFFASSFAFGCTAPARDDGSNAGSDVKSGAARSAADANQAASASDVAPGGMSKTQRVSELTGAKAAPASAETAEAMAVTAKVKSAILADKRVTMPSLSIHTKPAAKHVIIGGVTPLAAVRDAAIADAEKEVAKENAGYTIISNIEVGKPRPF